MMLDRLTYTFSGAPLTPTEYRLLACLDDRRGSVVSHRDLIRAGWNALPDIGYRACLRVSIAQLRRKIGHHVIESRPYHGYVLAPPAGSQSFPVGSHPLDGDGFLKAPVPSSASLPALSQTDNWKGVI